MHVLRSLRLLELARVHPVQVAPTLDFGLAYCQAQKPSSPRILDVLPSSLLSRDDTGRRLLSVHWLRSETSIIRLCKTDVRTLLLYGEI